MIDSLVQYLLEEVAMDGDEGKTHALLAHPGVREGRTHGSARL